MPRAGGSTAIEALRAVVGHFPQVEELVSHGSPNWRVRGGRVFAIFAANHHGDGRVALWLRAADGAQDALLRTDARQFFVPPYVGPSGWVGVRLDRGLAWTRVAGLLRDAWREGAPSRLHAQLGPAPRVMAPVRGLTVEELDPMQTPEARRAVAALREICLALPGSSESTSFGKPVWRVGRRTFAQCWRYDDGPVQAAFWVGVERQGLMTADRRYTIPPYLGHAGWIALDVTTGLRRPEVEDLAAQSHAHFGPKRRVSAPTDRSPRAAPARPSRAARRRS
jgi:hypothetical protein